MSYTDNSVYLAKYVYYSVMVGNRGCSLEGAIAILTDEAVDDDTCMLVAEGVLTDMYGSRVSSPDYMVEKSLRLSEVSSIWNVLGVGDGSDSNGTGNLIVSYIIYDVGETHLYSKTKYPVTIKDVKRLLDGGDGVKCLI